MDPELKGKWVDALRSGDYEQGRAQLRSKDDTYCCLGVLLDCIDGVDWELNDVEPGQGYLAEYGDYPRAHLDLANLYLDLVGMDPLDQGRLINLNDEDGAGFNEIASWIEENL